MINKFQLMSTDCRETSFWRNKKAQSSDKSVWIIVHGADEELIVKKQHVHPCIQIAGSTFIPAFVNASATNVSVYLVREMYCQSSDIFTMPRSMCDFSAAQARKSNKWRSFSLTKLPKSLKDRRAPSHSRECCLWFLCDFNDGKRSRNLLNLTVWELSLSFTSVNSLMAGAEDCI